MLSKKSISKMRYNNVNDSEDTKMKITGEATFSLNLENTVKINLDTNDCSSNSPLEFDLVAYALYGETIFENILRDDLGVPLIVLEIKTNKGSFSVVRQPEYLRETHFGTRYLAKEVLGYKEDQTEYPSLSKETYNELLKSKLDLSFEEFKALVKKN